MNRCYINTIYYHYLYYKLLQVYMDLTNKKLPMSYESANVGLNKVFRLFRLQDLA